jgi:hypothetical protein
MQANIKWPQCNEVKETMRVKNKNSRFNSYDVSGPVDLFDSVKKKKNSIKYYHDLPQTLDVSIVFTIWIYHLLIFWIDLMCFSLQIRIFL